MMRKHIFYLKMILVTVIVTTGCQQARDRSILRGMKVDETHTGGGHVILQDNKDIPSPEPECIKISDVQMKLLLDKSLSQKEKIRLVNAIYKTIRGKPCPGVIAFLNSIFKDDPVADLINQTAQQLQRMKAKDVVALAAENPELPLDAEILWKMAKQIDVQKSKDKKTVVVTGIVRYRGQKVQLRAAFDAKFASDDMTSTKMSELTKGSVVQFKTDKEGNLIGTTMMPEKEESPQKSFDEIVQEIQKDRTKAPANVKKNEIKRLNFSTAEMDAVNECGGAQTRQMMKMVTKSVGASMTVNGLTLSDNDEFSLKRQNTDLKTAVEKLLDETAKEPAVSSGFLLSAPGDAYYYLQVQHKKGLEFNGAPSVDVSVSLYSLKEGVDLKKLQEKGRDGITQASFIADPKDESLQKEFEVSLDPNSAYWMKVRAQRILQCLIQKQVASPQTSYQSVESALFYILIQDKISYLLAP